MECEKVAQLHSNNLIVLASSNCFEFITAFILNYDRINSTKKLFKQQMPSKLTASCSPKVPYFKHMSLENSHLLFG